MASIFSTIYAYLARHSWLLYVLSLFLIIYCVIGVSRIQLDNDILSVIPSNSTNLRFRDRVNELQNNRELLLLIHQKSTADTTLESLVAAADWLHAQLNNTAFYRSKLDISHMQMDQSKLRMIFDSVFYNLPVLIDSSELASLIAKEGGSRLPDLLDRNNQLTSGYSGVAIAKYVNKDPFHLTSIVFEKLKSFQIVPGLHQVNNYQVSADNRNLILDLTIYPATLKEDRLLIDSLKSLKQVFEKANQGADLYMFGAPLATDINRSQSVKDAIITGIISVIFILLLLFYFFRNRRIPFIALIPSIGGFAFALATYGWMSKPLVAMSLSSGTVILAMGINYAIHLINGFLFSGSRKEAIAEVVTPLVVGNFTTVIAFLMLQQSDSLLLRQYSTLSVLSLIMGALLTLVFVPHWLPANGKQLVVPQWVEKFSHYSFHRNKWLMLFVLFGTCLLFFPARKIQFQGDLTKLNYVPSSDQIGLNIIKNDLHFDISRTLITLKGDNLDSVFSHFQQVRKQLISSNPPLIIPDITAISPPVAQQYRNVQDWKNFWSDSIKSTLLRNSADINNPAAIQLNKFIANLSQFDTTAIPERISPRLRDEIAGKFIQENGSGEYILEVPVVGNIKNVNPNIKEYLFERKEFTKEIAQDIQKDFNNLLWLSAIGVFFILLLFYGRLELAILAFIPMAISWIWILGIAYMFHLDIHIINLILCTFIFGLCDDYSIFMVDGLSKELKYGSNQISKDRQIILISILLTVMSLVSLLFGKHPAFHSFAILAIVGLVVVLILALTIQPWLYEFFILSRTKKGNQPVTLITYFFSCLTFTFFITFGLLLSLVGVLLKITGLIQINFIKKIYLKLISWSGSFVVWTYPFAHVEIKNKQYFNPAKPGIFIANHQSHIDLLALPWINSNMVVMTNKWVYNNPVYGLMVRSAGYLPGYAELDKIIDKAHKTISQGISILVFPEGSRSADSEIRRFHKGAFYLAEKLQVPIYPVVVHGLGQILTKGEQYIKPGFASLNLLPAIAPDDLSWGDDYVTRSKTIARYFRQQFADIRDREETPDYNFHTLSMNYLYKGSVLYWYAKVKTVHEGLYRSLNQLIGKDDTVIDIGTGYGMLPLMLKLSGRKRRIIGFDYDGEKITVAKHLFSRVKYKGLDFFTGDLKQHYKDLITAADIFILYDVLHYINPEHQRLILTHCISMMKPGGKIIIREGLTINNKLKRTGMIEFFSTRFFKFNRTSESLHFISDEMINEFCQQYHLNMHIIHASRHSSDTLFYLSKQ